MCGDCGKRVALLSSVVGEGHAEKVKVEHKAEGQRWFHADS